MMPVSGRVVNVRITRPDGSFFTQDYTTDSEGKIGPISWTIDMKGDYLVEVVFNGDAQYLASSDVKTIDAKTVPSAPLNLTAIAGDGQITLNWDAPLDDGGSPILEYNIYRGDESGKEILIAKVKGNVVTLV